MACAASARDRADGVHVAGLPGEVHRKDRARARRQPPLDLRRVDVERVRSAVREHRARPEVLDDGGRGGERHRRCDHLVAGAHAHGLERQVQRGRARVHCQRVLRADELGELALELLHLEAGGEPARAKAVHDFIDLLVAEERCRERKELATHRMSFAAAPPGSAPR